MRAAARAPVAAAPIRDRLVTAAFIALVPRRRYPEVTPIPVQTAEHIPASPISWIGSEFEPASRFERLCFEGADFNRAAYIDGHRDAIFRDRGCDDVRTLRQQRRDLRRRASLGLENAIADDADH